MDGIRSRLKEYLTLKGWKPRDFERITGLGNGTCASIGNATRKTTFNRISKACPDLDINWLLTGDGTMLKEPVAEPAAPRADVAPASAVSFMVPLINIDSVGGVWSENDLTVSEQYVERMIPFDGARPGDAAIMQSGDSMDPIIPSGSVLHIRKVEQWREFLDYNCVYVLLLKDDRRITKLVRKFDEDPHNYILCCSYNQNNAPQELPRTFIREVWKVINVLIPRGW